MKLFINNKKVRFSIVFITLCLALYMARWHILYFVRDQMMDNKKFPMLCEGKNTMLKDLPFVKCFPKGSWVSGSDVVIGQCDSIVQVQSAHGGPSWFINIKEEKVIANCDFYKSLVVGECKVEGWHCGPPRLDEFRRLDF